MGLVGLARKMSLTRLSVTAVSSWRECERPRSRFSPAPPTRVARGRGIIGAVSFLVAVLVSWLLRRELATSLSCSKLAMTIPGWGRFAAKRKWIKARSGIIIWRTRPLLTLLLLSVEVQWGGRAWATIIARAPVAMAMSLKTSSLDVHRACDGKKLFVPNSPANPERSPRFHRTNKDGALTVTTRWRWRKCKWHGLNITREAMRPTSASCQYSCSCLAHHRANLLFHLDTTRDLHVHTRRPENGVFEWERQTAS